MLTYQTVRAGPGRDWILMLHGLGGSSNIWYKQIPELGRHYNLLIPDYYGHGQTREVLPEYTFPVLADETIRLLDQLSLKRVHVMGISIGSVIASFTALWHPERVKFLILGGTGLELDARTRTLLYLGHVLKQFVPYMWLYKFFAWILMPGPAQAKGRKIFAREARNLGGKEFKKWYRLLLGFQDLSPQLAGPAFYQIPKLYISGGWDHLFVGQVKRGAERDPLAELHIIEKSSHVCNIMTPEEFNRVCLEYLDRS